MTLRRRAAMIASAALLCASACATVEPEKKPPPTDEFQGFAALRGEPKEKKKPAADDKAEKGDEKAAAKADPKGKGEEEEKTALNKEQVLGAIATAQKRVDACLKKFKEPGIYVAQITIAPDGTSAVEPMRAPTRKEEPELWNDVEAGVDGGKNPKSPTNKCLAAALTQVKYPAFQGKPLVVTYPLILR